MQYEIVNHDYSANVIPCHSEYRVSAYETMEINLEQRYFCGGAKTAQSKNRIVPIHSGIYGFVKERIEAHGKVFTFASYQAFRKQLKKHLAKVGIDDSHTAHDCRHTFSALCEKYRVSENDRKRTMGHNFGSDITNAINGYRDLEPDRF